MTDFTPYKRSDFFFNNTINCVEATDATGCAAAKTAVEENRALYEKLATLQMSSAGNQQRFSDVAQKYDRDITSIATNILGCLVLLAILYRL